MTRRAWPPRWARGFIATLRRDMAKNTFWIVASSVVNMSLGIVVTALTARYFGPTEFGRFNYALALVVLFTAFSTLGLETLTVRSLVTRDHAQSVVMGTSLILRLCGGLVLTGISLGTRIVLEPTDRGIGVLVSLLSLMMVLRASDVIDYWFQARLKSKIAGLIRIGSYAIASALKVLVIVADGSIYQFAAVYSIDAAIVGVAFAIVFRHLNRGDSRWKWDRSYAKDVLAQSWFIMLSGFMGTVYLRVDQVMLGTMESDKASLGVFAAAVALATMWYFIPAALISSVNPGIMRASRENKALYMSRVQDLYTMVAWMALGFCIFLAISADVIVQLVYGSAYGEAADILRVSVFAGVFAMLGSARAAWLICEGLQRYAVVYSTGGAAINVLLNLYLIPIMGGYGAALATVAAQATSVLLIPMLFRETRISTHMMLRALDIRRAHQLGLRFMGSSQARV